MSLTELEAAKKDLALREGLRDDQIGKSIGFVTAQCAPKDSVETEVKRWLIGMGADAAIWTKLQPKIGQEYRKPAIDEVIEHLREKVSPEQRAHAEEYVRRAPRQIDTDYRRRIEFEFGWSPVG